MKGVDTSIYGSGAGGSAAGALEAGGVCSGAIVAARSLRRRPPWCAAYLAIGIRPERDEKGANLEPPIPSPFRRQTVRLISPGRRADVRPARAAALDTAPALPGEEASGRAQKPMHLHGVDFR